MSEVDENTIKIDEVVSEKRGERTGNGSAIMKMVTDNADKNNVKLVLTPNLIGEMKAKGFETADKLRSFYEKFGFVKDKGKATMTREPKLIEKAEVKPTEVKKEIFENEKAILKRKFTPRDEQGNFSYSIIDKKSGEDVGNVSFNYRDDLGGYQIENIKVKNSGTGIGFESYKILIKSLDKPLISDSARTASAEKIWQKLVKEGIAKYDAQKEKYISLPFKEVKPTEEKVLTATEKSFPISELNKIPKGELHRNEESQNKLIKDISENGIKEPLTLVYYAKDNALRLKEGHHRLDAANKLGLKDVPVKVQVEWDNSIKDDKDIEGQELYHPPVPLDIESYKKRNYQPNNINLSELGFKEKLPTEEVKPIEKVKPIEVKEEFKPTEEEIKISETAAPEQRAEALKQTKESYGTQRSTEGVGEPTAPISEDVLSKPVKDIVKSAEPAEQSALDKFRAERYKSEDEFTAEYNKPASDGGHRSELGETKEEFLLRKFCE